ncbi:MAG: CHAT domain-containing tetratricopeptide repeat protein [Saprospiraceae bacterium]
MNRNLWLFILLIATTVSGIAQINPKTLDTLEELYRSKEYIGYLTKIMYVEKNLNKDTLFQENMDLLLTYIERYIPQKDPLVKFQLRKTYRYHGYKFKDRGDLHKAIPFYLKAHSLVDDPICLDTFSFKVENIISTIYTQLDDFEKSRYFIELVINSQIFFENWKDLSLSYNNLAQNYYSAKDTQRAIENYQKGIGIAKRIAYQRGVFSNQLGLSEVFLAMGKLDTTENLLNSCLTLLPLIQKENGILQYKGTTYHYFSILESKKLNYISAIHWQKLAIDTLSKYHNGKKPRAMAKQFKTLSELFLEDHQIDSASFYYIKGIHCLLPALEKSMQLPEQNYLYQENTFIELFNIRAQIYSVKYQSDPKINFLNEELKSYETILKLCSNTIDNILGDHTKLLGIQENKFYVGKALSCINRLLKFNSLKSLFPRIRAIFDDSKSLLVDQKLLEKAKFESLSKKDQEKIQGLYQQRREIQDRNDNNLDLITSNLMEINRILNQSSGSKFNSTSPQNYIEYSYHLDSIYVLAELGAYRDFRCLGTTQKFKELLERFQHEMAKHDYQDTGIFHQLSDYLLNDLQDHLTNNIVIIPDGPIAYIPFEALKKMNGSFLVEEHNIHYQFNYSQQISKNRNSVSTYAISILSPDYESQNLIECDYESQNLIAYERGSPYELKYADQDCKAIQDQIKNARRLTDTIHRLNLLDYIQESSQIFHFAGHAQITSDSSYLVLSQGRERLYYEDISSLYNQLNLVVLSACETGLGKWDPGDGSRSLAKAFIESGSQSVVSSLWKVNDKSGSEIISNFYTYLVQGKLKSEALREAKLNFIRKSSIEERHPYYWSAFIAVGDMDPIKWPNALEIFFGVNAYMKVTFLILGIIVLIIILNKIKFRSYEVVS